MKTDNWADDNRSSVKRLAASCSSPIFLFPILLLASYLFFGSYRMMYRVYRGQQLEMKAHKSMVTDRTTEREGFTINTHTH
jgi:ABC-type multidrug transport system permease subunit